MFYSHFQNLQQLKLSLESNSFSFSFTDKYYDEISYDDTNGFQLQSNLFMSSAVFQNNDDATIHSTHVQSHVANLDATKRVYQTDVKYVACEDMDLSMVPGGCATQQPPSSLSPLTSFKSLSGGAAPPWVHSARNSGAAGSALSAGCP